MEALYLDRISGFETTDQCDAFIKNAQRNDREDLVTATIQRRVEIQGGEPEAFTNAAREGWNAIAAYENILRLEHGKNVKASRTRKMIDNIGMVPAIARIIMKRDVNVQGLVALRRYGLEQHAFEAVVLRNKGEFQEDVIRAAAANLEEMEKGEAG